LGSFAAQPLKRDLLFIHSYPQVRQIFLAFFAAVDPTSPHGYYCTTRNTLIRSQTTIQPRAGSRGGIGLKTLLSSRFQKAGVRRCFKPEWIRHVIGA
jgi:hypothetical protein